MGQNEQIVPEGASQSVVDNPQILVSCSVRLLGISVTQVLTLSSFSRHHFSAGHIVNLMSSDIETFYMVGAITHFLNQTFLECTQSRHLCLVMGDLQMGKLNDSFTEFDFF